MPTQTDPSLAARRPSLDSPTVSTPAVTPGGARDVLHPRGPAVPSVIDLEPVQDAAADPAVGLPYLADVLHGLACGCDNGRDSDGHGVDFVELANALRGRILTDAGLSGRTPVEAKVWAGTWGTLAATVGLALVTLLLDRLDVIPTLFAGDYPWIGGVVLVLGVVLPPLASFLRGYLAAHTPRGASGAGR